MAVRKHVGLDTDTTLGGNSAADDVVASQKAIKTYIDSQTGTAPAFANLTGSPYDNTKLSTALNAKQNTLTWTYDSTTETLTIS